MLKKYLSLTLLFPALSFASSTIQTTCSQSDTTAIRAAILNYIEKNAAMTPQDITIQKMKCSGGYASAILHPTKPMINDAGIYLHKNAHWDVLKYGSDFDPKFLKQIPKKIRTY